jgi:hypothetical protein
MSTSPFEVLPKPELTPVQMVAEYISLRDAKKKAEDSFSEYVKRHFTGRMEEIENLLLDFLHQTGSNSIAGEAGTVYKKVDTSVTVADALVFREYIVGTGQYEFADFRPAKGVVVEHIKNEGTLPPGLNFTQRASVGIRRR